MSKKRLIKLAAIILSIGGIFATAGTANAATAIDVASYQTGINLPATNTDIAIMKATQGTGYTNPDFHRAIQQAKNAGQGVGAYDFAVTGVNPTAEANHFINVTRPYIGKGVLPILDWEPASPCNVDWALTWLQKVEAAYGVKPMIYMNISTENSCNWSRVVQGNYGLWIAGGRHYNTVLTKDQVPAATFRLRHWKSAAMWQYTSFGVVNGWGGRVDLSHFYGDMTAWNRYANSRASGSADVPYVAPKVPAASPARAATTKVYVVRRGDNLSTIGARLGVRWTVIANLNGLRSPYTIYPGQNLKVNNTTAVTGKTGATRTVTVRSGDSLSRIASRLGIKWTQLHGYRSGNPNIIYPGETLAY